MLLNQYFHLKKACYLIQNGGVLAYPTEAIIGLGCDPWNETAVKKILQIKQRSIKKGLIIVGDTPLRLKPFIHPDYFQQFTDKIAQSDNQPTTWLTPFAHSTPHWLTGEHKTIALRVIQLPLIADLIAIAGLPIVSTSANISNTPPCKTIRQARLRFGTAVDGYLPGMVGSWQKPSKIIHLVTDQVQRDH